MRKPFSGWKQRSPGGIGSPLMSVMPVMSVMSVMPAGTT